MKSSLKRLSSLILLIILYSAYVFAETDEDFYRSVKYFKEKNYPAFKSLARDLSEDPKYAYQISMMLAEVYFQENNIYEAYSILSRLYEQYPLKGREIKQKLERIEKEKAFLEKSSRDRSKKFEIFFSEESPVKDGRVLEEIFSLLDEAQYEGGKFFRWYPDDIIKVMIYYGDDYKDYTVLPLWSQGGFDGKIRIQLNKHIKTERLKEIVFHEYAHLAIEGLTKGNCPLWFNEGVAQYFAVKNTTKHFEKTAKKLTPEDFPKRWEGRPEKEIKELYNDALALVIFIAREAGDYGLYDILTQLGEGKSFRQAIDSSFSYLGLNYSILFNR